MKYQLAAAVSLAASAAAAPSSLHSRAPSAVPDSTSFSVVAMDRASSFNFLPVQASNTGLFLNLQQQNATCASPSNYASFYLFNGQLFLWTPEGISQQLYTDRSGFGQGIIQYSTTPGGYQPGIRSELTGWVVDEESNLTFNGTALLACPNIGDGSWSIRLNTTVPEPAGRVNCTTFGARALIDESTNRCTYSYVPVPHS